MRRAPVISRPLPGGIVEYTDGIRTARVETRRDQGTGATYFLVRLVNDRKVARIPRKRQAVKGALNWIHSGVFGMEGRQLEDDPDR